MFNKFKHFFIGKKLGEEVLTSIARVFFFLRNICSES